MDIETYANLYDLFVGGTNVMILRKMLEDHFTFPRSTVQARQQTMDFIFERLSLYTLETKKQKFKARTDDGTAIEGTNVIGVIPGKNRGEPENGVIVIGAHYDSHENSAGVDDNGSGIVALLEVCRILSPKMNKFNNTIIFVAFDLEKRGILGSLAFVNQYLIPTEISRKRANFIGAYILDMVLNFDPSVRSQTVPFDVGTAIPDAMAYLKEGNYKGDFLSVWSRRVIDWDLWYPFQKAWMKEDEFSEHKLVIIDPPIPRAPVLLSNWRYRSFLRGDHAAFWSHKHFAFKDSLRAVLLTDTGSWRGYMRVCFHEFCDDRTHITTDNLEFLRHVVDSLSAAVAFLGE
ncbi:uncharacterized protein B4U80_08033 [Leptotrombidium deliense]|uniref:Peptidase M28 domain-containing protein n=1 Tax=Leptotrombidium deliense TaxID=299467 RepID=A0A443SJV1_9ACAR|nr:uncharacterized protein B4U80_08033 [Leptotrombidium deliense]